MCDIILECLDANELSVIARRYALETKAAAALIIATVAGLFTVSDVLATLLTRSDGAY